MWTVASYLWCILLTARIGCASWFMKGEPPEVLGHEPFTFEKPPE
jgi:hypothetical protein